MPEESILGVAVGQKAELEKTISEDDVTTFARISGDNQPLHLDDAYAGKTRFKRRVAHGMLSAGLISAALGTRLAPNATVIYLSQSLRFVRPVYLGDTVTAHIEVTAIDPEKRFVTCSTECVNQDGQSVLTGEATVLLDALR
ncbi:MAG: MaoC family dehydratase [Dehalococcoidia bacterium]